MMRAAELPLSAHSRRGALLEGDHPGRRGFQTCMTGREVLLPILLLLCVARRSRRELDDT
jgi:hypothetical protein